ADFGEEEGTAVHAGMAAQGVPALADDDRTALAEGDVSANRLPGADLLRGAQAEEDAEQPRRSGPGVVEDVREAGHFAQRTEAIERRGGGRGGGQRVGGDDVLQGTRQAGNHFLFVHRGGAEASGTGGETSRDG